MFGPLYTFLGKVLAAHFNPDHKVRTVLLTFLVPERKVKGEL